MEQMRSEFEDWAKRNLIDTRKKYADSYMDIRTHFAWEAWQASRAAIELDLPKKYYSEAYLGNGCCDDYANNKLDEVYSVVRAAGLRVKEE